MDQWLSHTALVASNNAALFNHANAAHQAICRHQSAAVPVQCMCMLNIRHIQPACSDVHLAASPTSATEALV